MKKVLVGLFIGLAAAAAYGASGQLIVRDGTGSMVMIKATQGDDGKYILHAICENK